MNSPEISIIVPVYNTEKYLCQCLDSILSQTHTDFEVILVDDGSTDKSGAICDEYVRSDGRFRVIHKTNGGVGSARNEGIYRSLGKYITFVDSDDLISSDYLMALWKAVQTNGHGTPVVNVTALHSDGTTRRNTKYEDCVIKTNEFIQNKLIYRYCVGYLFYSEIIKREHIRFDESLKMSEDVLFILNYLQFESTIILLSKELYYYRQNPESVCHTVMTYEKTSNFIKSATLIMELDESSQIDNQSINKEFQFQLKMFYLALLLISPTKEEVGCIKTNIRELYRLYKNKFEGQSFPFAFPLSMYSLSTYLFFFRIFQFSKKILSTIANTLLSDSQKDRIKRLIKS